MKNFGIMFKALESLDQVEALKKAIKKNEKKILDLNRQQLDQGKDSVGKSLGEYVNIKYKGRRSPIDLLNKGSFRAKFKLKITDKHIEIYSTDWKEDILIWQYGKDIHGIPRYLVPGIAQIVQKDFEKFIKNARTR
jgi:hypothetical protein